MGLLVSTHKPPGDTSLHERKKEAGEDGLFMILEHCFWVDQGPGCCPWIDQGPGALPLDCLEPGCCLWTDLYHPGQPGSTANPEMGTWGGSFLDTDELSPITFHFTI